MTTTSPVLALSSIHKSFPGVKALTDVSLRLFPGEVHALMGQNGAGKSTLIKVLTGLYQPDAGSITLDGKVIAPKRTEDAQELGIRTVYQEVNLCPNLTVAENIFAGRYPRHPAWQGRRIDWAATREGARRLLARVGLDIDVTRRLSDYPVAIQQLVAIARALGIDARVLILDEPTSSLDDDEVKGLFQVLRRLREEGLAILFVTHFLDQVYAISDRITVLRNGRWIGEWTTRELPAQALIEAMVKHVDTAIGKMTDAASSLGAVKTRIDIQKNFADSMKAAIDKGIGQLVDADMNEESTRLQALQVKQQLSIQSLSIANQGAQSILSLFR